MARSALVIGGAGKVGSGVARACRDAGMRVIVVDPAGGDVAEVATAALAERVGPVDLAVISLPARGQGRAEGEFRAAEVAQVELPRRLAALELAMATLADGGCLVEFAGGAAVDPGRDEAGLIGRWQCRVRGSLDGMRGVRAILCAITCFVPPERAGELGPALLGLATGGRGGVCRLDAVEGPVEWVG